MDNGNDPAGLRPPSVAGVDEAGRGCLAGPVVAAAVVLPPRFCLPQLTDSKKLSPRRRQELTPLIRARSTAWAVGLSWPREIDRLNILQASLLAMRRAVNKLNTVPDMVLVDGNQRIPIDLKQQTIVGGDLSEPCISAASVLAKVFRDRLMQAMDRRYPGYGFAAHKGYGTREHREVLKCKGPSPIHRTSFKGVLCATRRERINRLPGL
ncbi:MAG: ribonuclease HII [Desulfonatronovibrionaceae bacterium]